VGHMLRTTGPGRLVLNGILREILTDDP